MTVAGLNETARAITADGKGILAADETVPTLTRRLQSLAIESSPDSRRAFRELLFTTPDIGAFIGGVILQDETIHQQSSSGVPMPDLLAQRGVVPGIKVDDGAHPMANAPGELITEGLDGLRSRLINYRQAGARFAKWRAVIVIGEARPSLRCIRSNAHALARYAALCQEQSLVPIIEPEVLMDGRHGLDKCEEVTGYVLEAVFDALYEQRLDLEGIILKPNMVTPGRDSPRQANLNEVAAATLRALTRHVPPAVPAVVFLSGGQSPTLATEHLSAINQLEAPKPWRLTFSYGRALQDEAMDAWKGKAANVPAAQRAFHHRARLCTTAALGRYRRDQETDTSKGDASWHIH